MLSRLWRVLVGRSKWPGGVGRERLCSLVTNASPRHGPVIRTWASTRETAWPYLVIVVGVLRNNWSQCVASRLAWHPSTIGLLPVEALCSASAPPPLSCCHSCAGLSSGCCALPRIRLTVIHLLALWCYLCFFSISIHLFITNCRSFEFLLSKLNFVISGQCLEPFHISYYIKNIRTASLPSTVGSTMVAAMQQMNRVTMMVRVDDQIAIVK